MIGHLRLKTRRQLYAIIEAQKEQLVELARDSVERRPIKLAVPRVGFSVVIRSLRYGHAVDRGTVLAVRYGSPGRVMGVRVNNWARSTWWDIGDYADHGWDYDTDGAA